MLNASSQTLNSAEKRKYGGYICTWIQRQIQDKRLHRSAHAERADSIEPREGQSRQIQGTAGCVAECQPKNDDSQS